jgi:hypothetical protein
MALRLVALLWLAGAPVMSPDSPVGEGDCITVAPPKGASCKEPVQLCRTSSTHGSCDGFSNSLTWAALKPLPAPPDAPQANPGSQPFPPAGVVLLHSEAGPAVELATAECRRPASGFSCFRRAAPPDGGAEELATREAQDAAACEKEKQEAAERSRREFEECERKTAAKLAKQKHEVRCEILSVDACARTLTARCQGQNPNEDSPPLGTLLTYSWKAEDRTRALERKKR